MKWGLIFVILTAFGTGFAVTGCDGDSSSGEYDATRPVVCLGDSITAGFINGVDYPDKAYPAHLQKKITVEVINAGVSGDTTANALARVENDVLSKNPQIVIIALGGNDLAAITGSENFQTVLGSMRGNLQNIINRVKGVNRKIYLVNYLSKDMISGVAGGASYTEEEKTIFYTLFSGVYISLAASNNITLINDLITAEIYSSHMSDSVHPDETGYEMIADTVFDVLEPFLLQHNLVK